MPSRHIADIRQVEGKTGRSLDEWCELLEANGIGERREAVNFLRDGYAVSHAFALAIRRQLLAGGSGRLCRLRPGAERLVRALRVCRPQLLRMWEHEPYRHAARDRAGATARRAPVDALSEDFRWAGRTRCTAACWPPWLDEVMAWAPASHDSWAVTAEMNIRYRSPANPGERLTASGRVTAKRRRIYQVHGEVHGQDGRLIAEADGRFLGATPTQKAALKQRYGVPVEVGRGHGRE